ncbi:unnamed protein product [Adineta steineri]|uniref:protein-tyrosine-phosphatase n=1 Tax=Adineta steineri TaxID=433720 RepID=A0A814DU62_9BILA|nr:unnamed protein product [Adineta steineri]CAF3937908.1 unnamed protein product [Adineta steineri]
MYPSSQVIPFPNEQLSATMRPSDIQALVRYNDNIPRLYPPTIREPWAPTIMTQHPYPTVPKEKPVLPSKKFFIMASTIGVVVGLCISGIPLAVMTTLYLQLKSQISSNGTADTDSSSLPSQCSTYTTNSDATRRTTCTGPAYTDCALTAGWYQFTGSGGTKLATTPSSIGDCCTTYSGWFNGTLPSTYGTTTVGMNYFHNNYILAEKPINMFPNADKPTKPPTTLSKRVPLTKAYSCSDASSTRFSGNCEFITPREFVELVSQNSNSQNPPILDCRSQMDFGSERIRSSHNINCRTKIMARKLTSKRLEDVEPNLSSSLNKSDLVILYDQSTDIPEEDKMRSLPMNLVVQAAQKSNKKVQIIQGGLDAIKTEYPHLIECPIEQIKHKTDDDLIPVPATPESIDKENVVMTEIIPHIFVGNLNDAQNLDRLTQHGITHVVNCTPDLPFYWENKHKCLRIDVLDLPSQNIRKYFDTAVEFIDNALRSKGNVLVHCSAGISRSPTLVLAYLMKKNHWTLDVAFDKMRKLRQIVDPNMSFIIQLREWEKTLISNTTSASSLPTTPTPTSEIHDESSGINNSPNIRSATNTYCGSTSKSKTDTKNCTDATITVN